MRFIKSYKKSSRLILLFGILLFSGGIVSAQMRQVHLDNASNDLMKISFYSPANGYVAFKNWVGFTTDTGRTFIQKPITNNNVNYNGYTVNILFGFAIAGVKAISQDTIVVYGDYGFEPSVLYSSDGGNSFILTYHTGFDPNTFGAVTDVVFPQNNGIGYATEGHKILKSTDKGRNWSVVATNSGILFAFLDPIDNNNLLVYANPNKIYKTTNAGSSWQPVTIPSGTLNNGDFISMSKGWINMNNGSQNHFYYTSNGGTNWTQFNNASAPASYPGRMQFTNDSTGYIIGYGFPTLKTTDSGKIWEPLPRDNSYATGIGHYSMQCMTNTQLWCGGSNGFLELSTNGGGTPLPKAYFVIDTANVYNTNIVNLRNYSKPNYQYQWFRNGALISSNFNTSYTADFFHPVDTIKLVVSNGANTDTLVQIQYLDLRPPVPVITSFTPISGSTGTIVNITGLNFTGTIAVSFGGTPASSFVVNSATSITAVVGGGSSGSVAVTTQYATGSLAGFTFLYAPAPVITSFSPVSGPVGTTVTITGTNFDPVAANNIVYFGSAKATIISGSSTQLIVQVPVGATYKVITLLNTGSHLTGYSTKPFLVTFAGGGGPFAATSFERIPITTPTGVWAAIDNGDLDNDGKPDIVISYGSANGGRRVAVYKNTSTIGVLSFLHVADYFTESTGRVIQRIAIADIDADGKLDIVATRDSNFNSIGTVSLLRNTSSAGNISFAPQVELPGCDGQYGLAINDLDGDGRPELVITRGLYVSPGINYSFSIFRNTSTIGNISFSAKIDYGTTSGRRVEIMDLDNDAKPDIIVSRDYPNDSTISIYKNISTIGNPVLAPKIDFKTADSRPSYLRVADYDGDDKPDILVSHLFGNKISTFRNTGSTGSISFANKVDFTLSGNMLYEDGIGDLNGDGKLDYAAESLQMEILNNLSAPGNISFAAPFGYTFSTGYNSLADYDGDGKLDIGQLVPSSQIVIFRNKFVGSLANAGPDAIICRGDSVQIGVSSVAGNTYGWVSSPAGFVSALANPFVSPIVTTSYFLTVSNGTTTAKDTVVVTVNAAPVANAGVDKVICASASTTIGTAATGGNTYSWTSSPTGFVSSAANPTVNPSVTTNYYLVATNGFGCTAKDTVIVNVSAAVANAGPDKQLCPGGSTSIGVAATGDTYSWTSNPAGFISSISNPVVSPGVTTNYFLKVTNPLGCIAYDTVTITVGVPVANAGPDKTICSGSITTIGTTGIVNNTYSWTSNPTGFISSTANPTVSPSVTTTYFLVVTNGSCSADDTVVVNVNSILTPSVNINASNLSICAGQSVTFTATATNGGSTPSYQWQVNGINAGTNSNTFTTTTLTNGSNVKVIMTSNANCISSATATSNTLTVNVSSVIPAVVINASATTICTGATVNFTAVPINGGAAPVYQWKKNGTNVGTSNNTYSTNTLLNGDVLSVTLTSNASCANPAVVNSNNISITVNPPATPGITISGNTTVVQGSSTLISSNIANGGSSPAYQWQDSTNAHTWLNIVNANTSTISYSPTLTGNKLRCVLTSNNPCVITPVATSNSLEFTVTPGIAGEYIRYGPNPVQKYLTIEGGMHLRSVWNAIHVVNTLGVKTYIEQNISGLTSVVINVEYLPAGLYVAVITTKAGDLAFVKFVKR